MNLHERVLSILSCRHVDDVLIDGPHKVALEMIASLRIEEVVHGTNSDDIDILTRGRDELCAERYRYPREDSKQLQAGIDHALYSEEPGGTSGKV